MAHFRARESAVNIDGSDINHLKIFLAVVQANGVSNAQSLLNKDASSISRALGALETRLGLKLCTRGRQGFELTPEGRLVHEETLQLFAALRGFQNRIESLGGRGSGRLAIGIIDHIISDPNAALQRAIAAISEHFGEGFHVELQVATPLELETQLLDKRLDVALGIFERRHDAIAYEVLYEETDHLYCAPGNPLAALLAAQAAPERIIDTLRQQGFCGRGFLNATDLGSLGFAMLGEVSLTSNLEGIALMVLSGKFVGFLPSHYAREFVARGELLAILPQQLSRTSQLLLAHRKGEARNRELIRQALAFIRNR